MKKLLLCATLMTLPTVSAYSLEVTNNVKKEAIFSLMAYQMGGPFKAEGIHVKIPASAIQHDVKVLPFLEKIRKQAQSTETPFKIGGYESFHGTLKEVTKCDTESTIWIFGTATDSELERISKGMVSLNQSACSIRLPLR